MSLVGEYRRQFPWRDWPRALTLCPVAPGQQILDLGCGPGDLSAVLAARGVAVTGIDRDPELLAAARANSPNIPNAKRRRGAAGAFLALSFLLLCAPGVAVPLQQVATSGRLPGVTIEASKERQALRLKVDGFVSSVIVQPWNEAISRWNEPVCPLVAGLPQAFGEFILRRITQAAMAARAPIAGEKCHPNLFVVASPLPEQLLEKWWARDRWMYDTRHGVEPVRSFIESKRPVRAWYNSALVCGGGAPAVSGGTALAIASVISGGGMMGGGGSSAFGAGAPTCTDGIDTHLSYADVRSIASAIVVVDLSRMKQVTIQQLADYIALLGLADVRADVDPGGAPSILRLFAAHATAPQGLTQWDRALLYSLYNTRQADKRQLQDLESTMLQRIAP